MKAVRGRITFTTCAALVVALGLSGCTLGGKSFSIDSNSRVPFFGLELRERKAKSNVPSYNSISRSKTDLSRIEAAVGAAPLVSVDLLKTGDNRTPTLVRITGTVENSPIGSAGGVPKADLGKAQSISLPRTNDLSNPSGKPFAASSIDFE